MCKRKIVKINHNVHMCSEAIFFPTQMKLMKKGHIYDLKQRMTYVCTISYEHVHC